MKTSEFKTKSGMADCQMPASEKAWPIGLDIGYSAVKGICPNRSFIFPAYARKLPEGRVTLKEEAASDLRYRDVKTGEIWTVGALAYDEVDADDVMDSEAELFGRHRYFSPMFLVIARTGMALGLETNEYGGPDGLPVYLETGLPPKYLSDASVLKEALGGHHDFELKIGNGAWKRFTFDLPQEHIHVMPQPLGALISASVGMDGRQMPIAQTYFSSNLVIFDPGFGTLDDYTVRKGSVVGYETFPELGMREVFARTCRDIQRMYGVEISVPELQNRLADGTIRSMDRREMKAVRHPFDDLLEKNSRRVCEEAVEKLKSVHNYYADVDYIIAAGGTYDAWAADFNRVFKDMEGLEIIPGNVNDPRLSNEYSNVRGYYFYLLNRLNR